MRPEFIVGNWKMNQGLTEVESFFDSVNTYQGKRIAWVAPQFIHLQKALSISKGLSIGAQNCADELNGAYTGEVSPAGLKELGVHFVIIGHSERRQLFNEGINIAKKVDLALKVGLKVIFCLGETLEERQAGQVEKVLSSQLADGLKSIKGLQTENLLIAYEPVWAIGTGKTATAKEAQEAHHFIREWIKKNMALSWDKLPILYGGSVKPSNIRELLDCPDIDGGLVGGASLDPKSYLELLNA